MSRRNILRPVIPTKSANPARGRGASDQQQQKEKRQKLSEDVPPSNASQSVPSEIRRPSPPKDLGRHTESHAGQAALKAYDKAAKVSAERERYRTDRDNFRAKFKISETQLQETDAEVEKLKKEFAEARTAASTAEAEVEKMKKEEREKLREADAKGYEAGIQRAALEYTQTAAHKMVNDELEVRLPDFYKLGYAAGADAMAGVIVVEADSGYELLVAGLLSQAMAFGML
ncbi:hypothetical protein RHGRI_016241 [Rhododendron griersonianum]|uniref:Uncharacterized protein n=1 Tax=Rhododendron griersonianum TaxID=479676 RepID=A0AAV6JTG3_9ERIC|nr:hypothetical protein RHGRI_016241 [Rhododendron griersonianum]